MASTAVMVAFAIAGNYNLRKPASSRVLVPTKDMSPTKEQLEGVIESKDDETLKAIAPFFADLVRGQEQRTSLLQQRASSLLATVSVVVTIILGGLGILIKDARGTSGSVTNKRIRIKGVSCA